jgi:hypothetical protein
MEQDLMCFLHFCQNRDDLEKYDEKSIFELPFLDPIKIHDSIYLHYDYGENFDVIKNMILSVSFRPELIANDADILNFFTEVILSINKHTYKRMFWSSKKTGDYFMEMKKNSTDNNFLADYHRWRNLNSALEPLSILNVIAEIDQPNNEDDSYYQQYAYQQYKESEIIDTCNFEQVTKTISVYDVSC